jgi:hypothetical protein
MYKLSRLIPSIAGRKPRIPLVTETGDLINCNVLKICKMMIPFQGTVYIQLRGRLESPIECTYSSLSQVSNYHMELLWKKGRELSHLQVVPLLLLFLL